MEILRHVPCLLVGGGKRFHRGARDLLSRQGKWIFRHEIFGFVRSHDPSSLVQTVEKHLFTVPKFKRSISRDFFLSLRRIKSHRRASVANGSLEAYYSKATSEREEEREKKRRFTQRHSLAHVPTSVGPPMQFPRPGRVGERGDGPRARRSSEPEDPARAASVAGELVAGGQDSSGLAGADAPRAGRSSSRAMVELGSGGLQLWTGGMAGGGGVQRRRHPAVDGRHGRRRDHRGRRAELDLGTGEAAQGVAAVVGRGERWPARA
jgi:hypothetical protein